NVVEPASKVASVREVCARPAVYDFPLPGFLRQPYCTRPDVGYNTWHAATRADGTATVVALVVPVCGGLGLRITE
ncbi:MAG TPA: hypothetical protein VM487_17125, partial [Phycisphaerae bacterium]|nr:hypothetical protein [Phycisphaerae bacterium]